MNWSEVRQQFDELVELSPSEREQRLAALFVRDQQLAAQLRELLTHDADASRFLEREDHGRRQPFATMAPRDRSEPIQAGQRLGRFTLLRAIGCGGMGSVWQAEQRNPSRQVAIKIFGNTQRTDAERWRFEHEIQVLAQLNHPAIATFYEAGLASGDDGNDETIWFAMELVQHATDLLSHCRERGLQQSERLDLFSVLCEAVEHGHRQGVLHRDIKPSNVLVDANGSLKLIDFGIARALARSPQDSAPAQSAAGGSFRTQDGTTVGTLQYMAPEQLLNAGHIGAACDVYALGVVLYQLLCDRAPFDFEGVPLPRIASIILEEDPADPRSASAELPEDLCCILLKALEKKPARRYGTVHELRTDLHRWRNHQTVGARPPSAAYRTRKFFRRHRIAALATGAVLAGAAVGATGLLQGIKRAEAGERRALRDARHAHEVAHLVTAMFQSIDDHASSREMRVHELLTASALEEGAEHDPYVEFFVRHLRGTALLRLRAYAPAQAELERALELESAWSTQIDDPATARNYGLRLRAALGAARIGSPQTGNASDQQAMRKRGEIMLREAEQAAAVANAPEVHAAVLEAQTSAMATVRDAAALEQSATKLLKIAKHLKRDDLARHAQASLADSANMRGQFDRALEHARNAWHGVETHGAKHKHRSLGMLSVYVRCLHDAGKLREAEALYPELIARSMEVFGATHTHTLTMRNNHAVLLIGQRKFDDAIATMRTVVATYDARGDGDSADVLEKVNTLGMALNLSGRQVEAEPYLRRCAKLSHAVLDARDPAGPQLRFNHAACLAALKRWDEARPILLAEHQRLVELLPPAHRILSMARRTIAGAYAANGDPEEAAKWRKP